MHTVVKLQSLLVFSEENKKVFFTEFKDGLNVVFGRNTSGKSTLIQSILYSFGINDGKVLLSDILDQEVIFRLDFTIKEGAEERSITFIRSEQNLLIQEEGKQKILFTGINADNSEEHKKLKVFIHNLFNFSLNLETKNGYVLAPIETIFLPYYVSQSVGWVHIRKSFNNLEFYRNFKEDFLDYYLNVTDSKDNLEKHRV